MKKLIYIIVLVLFSGLSYATTALTDCGNVSASNTDYNLSNNILKANCLDQCLDINASNITIDFKQFWINMTNASCSYDGNIYTHNNKNVTLRNLNSYVNTSGNVWVNVQQKSTSSYLKIYDSVFNGGGMIMYLEGDNNTIDNISLYTDTGFASEHIYIDGDNFRATNIVMTGISGYALESYSTNGYFENIIINNTLEKGWISETGLYADNPNQSFKNIKIINYETAFYLDTPSIALFDDISTYNSSIYSVFQTGTLFHLNITNAYFPDYGIETYYTGIIPSVFDAYVNFTSALASEDFSILGRTLILNYNGRVLYKVYNVSSGLYPCYDKYYCEINQTRSSQYVVSAAINVTAEEEPYFDLWGVLRNDLLGSLWLVIIFGLIITFYFSVYLNLSFQVSILSGVLWIAVISAITINTFLWAVVVLVTGTLFYFMVSQKLRRE